MGIVTKTVATLGGIRLAGSDAILWKIIRGTKPHQTTISIDNDTWDQVFSKRTGIPLELLIDDGNGHRQRFKDVFIHHNIAGRSPNRTSFVISDKRWKWSYRGIARAYNIPKKTGDRAAFGNITNLPEKIVTVDEYDYRPYSLNGGDRWTPQEAVEDILQTIEKDNFVVESWPLVEGEGQISLQNVTLQDSADVALSRLLAYIPGAELYVDQDGVIRVYDAADFSRARQHLKQLPELSWDGDKPEIVDRKSIRPASIAVHYERELEMVLEYSDDFASTTSADPARNRPFIENVIPTVDTVTTISQYDPETDETITKDVPAGTYVTFKSWLEAMNKDDVKPKGSAPWTFDTIKRDWLEGDLDGVLGGAGSRGVTDVDPEANVSLRVQALRRHFRQTFRINRRFVERVKDFKDVRIALLDTVTGKRAPAAVWGQACVVPSEKGRHVSARKDQKKCGIYRNLDFLPKDDAKLIDTPPGPASVVFQDAEQGIFRIEWELSPYGTVESFVPCNTVNSKNEIKSPCRDLSKQDTEIMGAGMRISGGTNEVFLRSTMEFKAMITIVPAAPNNKSRFHVERVEADDIDILFRGEFGIKDGQGPIFDVFVPPGEFTARFAWEDDDLAADTVGRLLGLNSDDPRNAGLVDDPDTQGVDESQMVGFQIVNKDRELDSHSQSAAAEILAQFADGVHGTVATQMPPQGLVLKGNMASASVTISAADSAKVMTRHEFPGVQVPVPRFALLSESARQLVQGELPFGKGAK